MKKALLKKPYFQILTLLLLFAVSILAGCEGDTGDTGATGPQGPPGPPGTGVAAAPESCGVCHGDITNTHAIPEVNLEVTDVIDGESFEVFFTVTVDGVPSDAYTLRRAYVNYEPDEEPILDETCLDAIDDIFVRDSLQQTEEGVEVEDSADVVQAVVDVEGVELTSLGNGEYVIYVPDSAEVPRWDETLDPPALVWDTVPYDIADSNYLFQLTLGLPSSQDSRPVITLLRGEPHLRDLITNEGCASCHGDYPAWSEKFRHYAVGGADCQICHTRDSRDTSFNTRVDADTFTTVGEICGTNLTEYIHGIHNSHHMPDGVYYRTTAPDDDFDEEDRYSIGYPSDIRSCNVCHTTEDQLAAAASAPVSYYLCMTCHQNWDGFVDRDGNQIFAEDDFHRTADIATNCMQCHGEIAILDEVADFHDFFEGADAGDDSFYRGEDISFENPNEVSFEITGVTVGEGGAVSFTWTASNDEGPVDPCNTDIDVGPTFQELRTYLAYAKGDDWVNEFVGTAPGQPGSTPRPFRDPGITTCAGNVATTTGLMLDPAATYAKKVLLALTGKPLDQDTFTIGAVEADRSFFVRAPSQTYAFDPADGSPAEARRMAVDTDKCLSCHRGTLYQHGGDRVDNEQLCVVCHNPSSNDKNNRLDRYMIINEDGTVNTDATYDGLPSQTYDMRYMIHSIHGVSKRDAPWVVYRSRGVYFFGTADMELPNGWPEENEEDPGSEPIYGSLNGSTINHNHIVVHYPRPVNFCEACHNEEAYEAVDQAKAVGLTVDAGTDWPDQSDDIVIGPTAAACTACHYSSEVARHATQDFGYGTNVIKDELLEVVY